MNATEYERRVQQMAEALHRDCELVWQARLAVDPRTQPDRWDAHAVRFHFGQAHDLVRRVFGEPDTPLSLREALDNAATWLEAEAEHPRPDPSEAMRLQARIIRDVLRP